MEQSGIQNVRLTSLNIIDFKTLQKGIVSWNFQAAGLFGVINVNDFYDRSTLFQAFQFGFGHDTDAQEAEVIVTLQRGNVDQIETWQFRHCKQLVGGLVQMTYGIQTDGFDEDFRAVDQKEYFDQFAELNVSALTQAFCFGGSMKNTLATSYIDLRSFLEMFLMGKELNNDYDERDGTIEMLIEEKKVLAEGNKAIKRILDAFNRQVEEVNHQIKRDADSWLLQVFFHHRHSNMLNDCINSLRQQIDIAFDSKSDELVDQCHKWEDEMIANALVEQKQFLLEVYRSGRDAVFEEQHKTIQDQIVQYEDEIRVLNTTNTNAAVRFCETYPTFEHDNFGLIENLENAQFNESRAKYDKVENVDVNDSKRIEKKTGKILIGMTTVEDSSWHKKLVDHQNEAKEELQRVNLFDAELYRYKDDTFTLENYIFHPPIDGICVVDSINLDFKIQDDYEADEGTLEFHVIVHNDHSDVKYLNSNPFGCLILNNESSTHFDMIQSSLSLQSMQYLIEKEDYSELCEAVKHIKDNEYFEIVIDDVEMAPIHQETSNLANTMNEIEMEAAAAKYSTEFNDLDFGTEPNSIISAIDCIKRHQGIFASNDQVEQHKQNALDRLTQIVDELKLYKQRLDSNLPLDLLNGQQQRASRELLINVGIGIVALVQKFVNNVCINSILLIKEALLHATALAIVYVNRKITELELELPFDLHVERSPEAYFDCISSQNACKFDENVPITTIYKTIASQIAEIELQNMEFKHSHIFYDDRELRMMAKKNKSLMKKVNIQVATERRQFHARVQAFEERFLPFVNVFDQLAQKCSTWNMSLKLSYEEPALQSPIQMLVCDPKIGFEHKQITTLNHQAAAFLLKLAINRAIGSPILILDSLDYIIEPQLISPIMMLLGDMAKSHGIQVIFMQVNPQNELSATSTHHMWTNAADEGEIANTSDHVLHPEPHVVPDEPNVDTRMVVQSETSDSLDSVPQTRG